MRLGMVVEGIIGAAGKGDREEARGLCRKLIEGLRTGGELTPEEGCAAADALRNVRAFDSLEELGRELTARGEARPKVRRLFGQALIERGEIAEALDVLSQLRDDEVKGSEEWAEATGLMGRALKDQVLAAPDKTDARTRDVLRRAIARYHEAYAHDPGKVWQGLNVLALSWLARRLGTGLAVPAEPEALARALVATLERTPPEERDRWYHASLAEVLIPLGRWDEVERNIGAYAQDDCTTAFQLAGTLRQLTQLWRLEDLGGRAQGLADTLRAALLRKEGGRVRLEPAQLQRTVAAPEPMLSQLEAVLGEEGPQAFSWFRRGTEVALSVALVRRGFGAGVGTGFVVRGGDLAPSLGEELLLLTNAHVVSDDPADGGLEPGEARVCFEAATDRGAPREIAGIVWRSPRTRLDASLLRLASPPPGDKAAPLPLAPSLPLLGKRRRVYVIGHPNGGELAISMQDNELLDHEGPPKGTPPDPDCCRVHYRAPTEPGSSGSPVFNSSGWQVIALHHKGGKEMPQLNGREGLYEANEGIWIRSIAAAAKKQLDGQG